MANTHYTSLHYVTLRCITWHLTVTCQCIPVFLEDSSCCSSMYVCFSLARSPLTIQDCLGHVWEPTFCPLFAEIQTASMASIFHIHIPSIRANLEDAIREEPQIYTLLTIFTLISLIFLGSLLIAQIAGMMRELGLNHQTQNSSTMFHMFRTCWNQPRPAVDYSWLYSVA